jgi:protein TonB
MSGTELLWAVSIGVFSIAMLIIFGRLLIAKRAKNLVEKHGTSNLDAPLSARNKYPEVDVLRNSSLFMRIGLVVALGLIIAAFSWTTYEKKVDIPTGALDLDVDLEIEPPRSAEPPPPPPPPPPPVIEAVPDEIILEEDEVEFVDQSVDANTAIEAPAPVMENNEAAPPPPPPPPPPPEPEAEEIFKVVEEMPRFPGCENAGGSTAEKKACADKKMLEFLYENLRYPSIARENNISGTVVIQFVVDTKGNISDARVAREIGGTCGEEALRVVNKMNEIAGNWTPGKQRGRAVKVMFSLPVKFVLKEY